MIYAHVRGKGLVAAEGLKHSLLGADDQVRWHADAPSQGAHWLAPPPHATWYVRRVGLPPALKALTCRLGAPAHPWNERAFSYPGRCRSGNAPTLYTTTT